MEKGFLIGSVIHKNNTHGEYPDLMIIDKVIISNGNSSSTKYLAVDKEGNVYDIYSDGIKKVISFPSQSLTPTNFINSSKKEE
jgi:hypothetical protein